MQISWNKDFLTRRIDRCYLVAAFTKVAEKRQRYINLARRYRTLLTESQPSTLHLQKV